MDHRCGVSPCSPCELDLLSDALLQSWTFLPCADLASMSASCKKGCLLAEPSWEALLRTRWSSLFQLAAPEAPRSWRAACAQRARARRAQLRVRASRWRVHGTIVDGKGKTITTGVCSFDDGSYAMRGSVVHKRSDSTNSLEASWQGNLCACIKPQGEKRCWSLAWREKLTGYPCPYDYLGNVHEVPGDVLLVRGEFTWLGRVRGTFDLRLERDHTAD
eukprot:TRINITY_DN24541_c0_g1_i1.p1 TRINITY_DN24541_c0_g1~~TRINITY_DN24541_c0_g1_i1.p1  ORF type:complete len:218 (+),score=25.70 TRINITY_DN24541_c0_g1_i1:45-698(+)